MAEQQPAKKKRRVKNPETFRERAIKANEGSDKPGIFVRFFKLIGRVIAAIFGPIFRAIDRFFNLKAMRPIKKIFVLIGKIIWPKYFRERFRELKKVTWPNWKQSRDLTFAVIVFAFVFGVAIAIVDYGLDKLFRAILLK